METMMRNMNVPLGMGYGDGMHGARAEGRGMMMDGAVCPRPKLWIGALIGAGAGIATSLIGGAAASRAAEKAEQRQREQEASEKAWYLRRYNEDYLDTAAGQNLVRRAKDYANEQWKKAAGAQAVMGGTDAAAIAAKEAGNKMVGDTIANIASADVERKAQVDNMHRQAEQGFAQMDMNRAMQRAQNITNAASAASNAVMSIGSAVDQASANKPNLQGASNNGTASGVSTTVTSDGRTVKGDWPTLELDDRYFGNGGMG